MAKKAAPETANGHVTIEEKIAVTENHKSQPPEPIVEPIARPIDEPVEKSEPMTIGRVETTKVISILAPDEPKIDEPPLIEIPDDLFADAPLFEDVEIVDLDITDVIEEVIEIEPDAVAVFSELSGTERPTNEKLSLELLGETKFKGGDRRTVSIMVCRGTARKVVVNAQIMIKVLGSTFRPVIFHARTDANGLANVHLQLPSFNAGRAALLVRAIVDNDEIELRRAVTPG